MVKNFIIGVLVAIIANMSKVWVVSDSRLIWVNIFTVFIVWLAMSMLDSAIEYIWDDLVRMVKEVD